MVEEHLTIEEQLKVAQQQAEAYKTQCERQYQQIRELQDKCESLSYKAHKVKAALDNYVQTNSTFINLLGKELI